MNTDDKILVRESESNGCKVRIYCAKEKRKNCKENILFYLMNSYEKRVMAEIMQQKQQP